MRKDAFTLVELLVSVAIIAILSSLVLAVSRNSYRMASLATSANNIRQLAAGAAAYLGDNDFVYWKYRENVAGQGVRWWFGFEGKGSLGAGEGARTIDPTRGPLAGYVPAGFQPDPSFALTGKPFKPKYSFGYIGVAYNVLLADAAGNRMRGWTGNGTPLQHLTLENPGEIVVFATSAQVNTFQPPASGDNPMIEEFYGIDDVETTVHFRHHGKAMVAFANGSAGFLEMDPATLDRRDPEALIGRFAPRGNAKYLR